MKQKVLVVIGTRPEAIKLAPVVLELRRRPDEFEAIVCATAQHREMLDQALEIFGITPDFDLNIMKPGQTLAQVTARAIAGIDQAIQECAPDITLVQGDTTSAFTGALASHYRHILIGHVEAGLRTGDKYAPFPEEMNRRLIGRMADHHFAPTEHARGILLGEEIEPETVHLTGNTVIDALLWVRERVQDLEPDLPGDLKQAISSGPMVLITGHRRESFGGGFEDICRAIKTLADRHTDTQFVYPVHLNPRVREPVNRLLDGHPRIHLIEPQTYEPFVWLMDRATLLLTDSGGVQEEAPSLGKPVLVMRDTTERPEGITAGNAKLVGVNYQSIVDHVSLLLTDPSEVAKMTRVNNPYGDGTAAKQIVDVLARVLIADSPVSVSVDSAISDSNNL